eukprot:scaffold312080_cov15-Tisochrysis_lutea.AAC.1
MQYALQFPLASNVPFEGSQTVPFISFQIGKLPSYANQVSSPACTIHGLGYANYKTATTLTIRADPS